jgi:lysine 2,3-aminomutase
MTTSPLASTKLTVVDQPRVRHLKARIQPDAVTWRRPRRDEFWRRIPAWREVEAATFLDHRWQERNAITSAEKLLSALALSPSDSFAQDLVEGGGGRPLTLRV